MAASRFATMAAAAKRFYRIIDFKRNKIGIPARVAAIEYDPNRSARIALLYYVDGEKRYMLAPLGLKVGDEVVPGPQCADPRRQCAAVAQTSRPVRRSTTSSFTWARAASCPLGRNVGAADGEVRRLRAGAHAIGEVRRVHLECMATLGQVGNVDHENIEIGKAGRARHMGKRPTVRGSVMNPRDHPHGGGEGKAPIGGQPKTPWGKPAFQRTRNNKRTDKMIVRRRPANRARSR